MPKVTDAQFEVVEGPRRRRRPLMGRILRLVLFAAAAAFVFLAAVNRTAERLALERGASSDGTAP